MKKHLLQAAERGNAEAQFNLAIMCENGSIAGRYTTEETQAEAIRWFQAAADQGLPRAQIRLAELYADAPETPESSVMACGWYLLAMTGLRGIHLQNAQAAHRRISDRLTPGGAAQAARFADDWKAIAPASLRPEIGA